MSVIQERQDISETAWSQRLREVAPTIHKAITPELNVSDNLLQLPAGQTLIDPQTPCGVFMILLEGTVRIYQMDDNGREVTLYRIRPGDVCIMSLNSLMHNRPFKAYAVTEAETSALALTPDRFLEYMAESADFRFHVLTNVSDRFLDMISLVQETVFEHLPSRVACFLVDQFRNSKDNHVKMTHQKLAKELGTSREVISRLLKEMEKKGCITLSRGAINLVSEDYLRRFIHLHK